MPALRRTGSPVAGPLGIGIGEEGPPALALGRHNSVTKEKEHEKKGRNGTGAGKAVRRRYFFVAKIALCKKTRFFLQIVAVPF